MDREYFLTVLSSVSGVTRQATSKPHRHPMHQGFLVARPGYINRFQHRHDLRLKSRFGRRLVLRILNVNGVTTEFRAIQDTWTRRTAGGAELSEKESRPLKHPPRCPRRHSPYS